MRRLFPSTWRQAVLWLAIAAMVGTSFTTAIFVFVGPIRLVSLAFHYLGWSGEFERLTAGLMLAVVAVLSVAISLAIYGVVVRTQLQHVRYGVLGIAGAFAILTGVLWMYPGLMISGLPDDVVSYDNFSFGSYPDEQRMEQLRRDGYALVTLIHPAILPYEKRLLEIERESAGNLGIELIEIPMLPWMAQNAQAAEMLRELSLTGEGNYYVHCWFGMHRTVDAANVITEARGGPPIDLPPGYSLRSARWAMPDLAMGVLLGAPVLFFTGVLAAGVGWLRSVRGMKVTDTRKIFHVSIFTAAAGLQLTLGLPAVIVFAATVVAAVAYAVYRGSGFPFYEAMARPESDGARRLMVLIPMLATGLGGVISNLAFFGWAHIGYVVTGWGDGAGESVGRRFGRHKYRVNLPFGMSGNRSVEGSAAVLVIGTIATLIGLAAGGVDSATALWVAPVVGLVATAIEAVSGGALDNLLIQVGASGTAYALAG